MKFPIYPVAEPNDDEWAMCTDCCEQCFELIEDCICEPEEDDELE